MAKEKGKTNAKQKRGATPISVPRQRFAFAWSLWIGRFLRSVAVILLTSALGVMFLQVPKILNRFPIEEIKIEGTMQFVDRVVLMNVVTEYTDKTRKINYFTVDLVQLRDELQKLPWIESVGIRKVWPNTLFLDIDERVAIAIWQDNQLISHKGDLFKPEYMVESINLPMLYGPLSRARYVMDNYHQMSKVLRPAHLRINELRLAERLAWQLKLNDQIVVLIDKDQSVEKLLKFVEIYDQLQERQIKEQETKIARVDLRYSNGIAVTWDGA